MRRGRRKEKEEKEESFICFILLYRYDCDSRVSILILFEKGPKVTKCTLFLKDTK
jgi:hypothetical protein